MVLFVLRHTPKFKRGRSSAESVVNKRQGNNKTIEFDLRRQAAQDAEHNANEREKRDKRVAEMEAKKARVDSGKGSNDGKGSVAAGVNVSKGSVAAGVSGGKGNVKGNGNGK